jgi:MerR family mercuric resistance operon transcriptional regulator
MSARSITIGELAKEANVGIETVRYYQRRGLVTTPGREGGTFRRYSAQHIARVRFIKRAQALGFSLEEIASLLKLNDGANRPTIRSIAGKRLAEIESRIADLSAMAGVLRGLVRACEHSGRGEPCPIIDAMTTMADVAAPH